MSARFAVLNPLDAIAFEARKKFDDAIYRVKTGSTVTADDLWIELREAQNVPGFAAAVKCTSILNELVSRNQAVL